MLDPAFSLVAVLMDVDTLRLRLNLQSDGCHGLWVERIRVVDAGELSSCSFAFPIAFVN